MSPSSIVEQPIRDLSSIMEARVRRGSEISTAGLTPNVIDHVHIAVKLIGLAFRIEIQ